MGLAYSLLYWLYDYSADFVLRRSLQETEAFLQRKHRPDTREILSTIAKNWRIITAGTLLVAMTTTTFILYRLYADLR
jgi:MHS family citrate/tricarballylate:H+ symporter-like MFS transporter